MEGASAQLHLTIETGSDPIAGLVAAPGEAPRRFDGWIELTAAIEIARAGTSRRLGPRQEARGRISSRTPRSIQ